MYTKWPRNYACSRGEIALGNMCSMNGASEFARGEIENVTAIGGDRLRWRWFDPQSNPIGSVLTRPSNEIFALEQTNSTMVPVALVEPRRESNLRADLSKDEEFGLVYRRINIYIFAWIVGS